LLRQEESKIGEGKRKIYIVNTNLIQSLTEKKEEFADGVGKYFSRWGEEYPTCPGWLGRTLNETRIQNANFLKSMAIFDVSFK